MSTGTLNLEQLAVRRIARNDYGTIRATLHDAFIRKHIQSRSCKVTMTTRALCSNKWTHIIIVGWRACQSRFGRGWFRWWQLRFEDLAKLGCIKPGEGVDVSMAGGVGTERYIARAACSDPNSNTIVSVNHYSTKHPIRIDRVLFYCLIVCRDYTTPYRCESKKSRMR